MTTTSNRLPRLLTVAQVAENLGVCTRTVRRLIKAGSLPTHRIGHQIRIAETDLWRLSRPSQTECPMESSNDQGFPLGTA